MKNLLLPKHGVTNHFVLFLSKGVQKFYNHVHVDVDCKELQCSLVVYISYCSDTTIQYQLATATTTGVMSLMTSFTHTCYDRLVMT